MKKQLILIGILAMALTVGCGGTYKQIEVEYPISPYAKYKALNLEITSPEPQEEADAYKEELKSFRELVISALQKRGIAIVDGSAEKPTLSIEILKFFKDSKTARIVATAVWWALAPGPNLTLYTDNAIEVKVSIKDKEKTVEFKEFQEYKEKIKDWEDLKRTVANRIADAVYYSH